MNTADLTGAGGVAVTGPKIEEETKFTYDELSPKAQAFARQNLVESDGYIPEEWWDCSFEEFVTCAALLGITIDTERNGKRHNIQFSGFSSQGDGACFVGSYRHEPKAIEMILDYSPQDKTLIEIAKELTHLQVIMLLVYGGTFACDIVKCSGSRSIYSHSNTIMTSEQKLIRPDKTYDCFDDFPSDIDASVQLLMRRFADWMYEQLEAEYDGYHDDDYLAAELREYAFDEDGSII